MKVILLLKNFSRGDYEVVAAFPEKMTSALLYTYFYEVVEKDPKKKYDKLSTEEIVTLFVEKSVETWFGSYVLQTLDIYEEKK